MTIKGIVIAILLTMLTMLSQSENSIKRATHQRYMLEAVLLRMASVESLVNIRELLATVEKWRGKGGGAPPAGGKAPEGIGETPPGTAPEGAERAAKKTRKPADRSETLGLGDEEPGAMASSETGAVAPSEAGAHKGAAAGMMSAWRRALENLGSSRASLASVLELGRLTNPESGVLLIEFNNKFHEAQVKKGKNLQILTDALEKITNTSVVIKTTVKPRTDEKTETADLKEIAAREPVVRAIIDKLGGRVRGIRRPTGGSE